MGPKTSWSALYRDVQKNRRYWEQGSDQYQRDHGPQLDPASAGWGIWQIPEGDLRVLGDVGRKDVLELGCGAAQWSIWLAGRGARPVGMDLSARQLAHAERLTRRFGLRFPLVQGSADRVPLAEERFDVVFCDHGAMSFVDPHRSVPEAARLLRPGGLLAFNIASPIIHLCWDDQTEDTAEALTAPYFGLHRWEGESHVEYNLPYGEWIRLFRRHGLVVEDLIELRPEPDATTTYADYVPLGWARRWPAENIWKARKQG
jgi:SAM-dependent methyltransferase